MKVASDALPKIYRDATGMGGIGPQEGGTYHRQMSELGMVIYSELGINDGQNGGVFMPQPERVILTQFGG